MKNPQNRVGGTVEMNLLEHDRVLGESERRDHGETT